MYYKNACLFSSSVLEVVPLVTLDIVCEDSDKNLHHMRDEVADEIKIYSVFYVYHQPQLKAESKIFL
jgi:hypothetical protein